MIHTISKFISEWCFKTLSITEEEKEIIAYGMEVLLDGILKVALLFIIGSLIGRTVDFAVAIIGFCSLRCWAGGVHCKTSLGCFLAMLVFCIASTFGADILADALKRQYLIWLILFYVILIWKAPGQTAKNPIDDVNLYIKKKRGSFIWLSLEFLLIALINNLHFKAVLFISILFEIFSIIPCHKNLLNQRRSYYAKRKK